MDSVSNNIEDVILKIESALDEFIDSGTEEELFLSGYLHGHFSLAVSQALQQQSVTPKNLIREVTTSLELAFENNELEFEDQQKVYDMWNKLAVIAS